MSDLRDWADRPYVRVYQSVRTDEKFQAVYDDDRALAAWVRLLLDADLAYPAQANLPAGLSRHARQVLTTAGVLISDGRRYTLSGLVKEREARKSRYGKDGEGRPRYSSDDGGKSDSDFSTTPVGARGRGSDSDSSSSESLEGGAGGNRDLDELDGPLAYYEVTTRYPSHNSELHAWTTALAEGYGAPTFQRALAEEFRANHRLNDLLSRTESRLAMAADRSRKANGPIRFDRKAWIEQKRLEQEHRDGAA